jgi:hypothetical protein
VVTKLDLSDHSGRIMIERDPALCELLNGDIGNLCGWLNFGTNLVSLVLAYLDLLFVLAQVCSCY